MSPIIVNHGGFRFDLEPLEAALRRRPGVKEVVVTPRKTAGHGRTEKMVAFVELSEREANWEAVISDLKTTLRKRCVPAYQRPVAYHRVWRWPVRKATREISRTALRGRKNLKPFLTEVYVQYPRAPRPVVLLARAINRFEFEGAVSSVPERLKGSRHDTVHFMLSHEIGGRRRTGRFLAAEDGPVRLALTLRVGDFVFVRGEIRAPNALYVTQLEKREQPPARLDLADTESILGMVL
jgi:hypothetical protein